MTDVLFKNALVLDPAAGELLPDRQVWVHDGRIKQVWDRPIKAAKAQVIDLKGRVLMPGLIDCHVHVTAATADFAALMRWSPFYVGARTADILRAMLRRGFTTVRDAGGAEYGIAQAVEEGYYEGPRVLFAGKALSQTGGHGDMRGRGESVLDACFCCPGLGRIVDGVDEIRRACRDEIRKGATHIKLMVSGGVASPTDRIGNTQFSVDEITAAVEEAEAAEIHVMAHAYTARAVNRALKCGVRSIEHGNLMDDSSADLFLARDAFLVPTLATYRALADEGVAAGMPKHLHAKVFSVLDQGIEALELAHKRGLRIAYGTDLLGIMHRHQLNEFALRSEVQKPIDIIRGATTVAAQLMGREGGNGPRPAGARADLLVVDGNPLRNVGVLQKPETHLKAIMKDGKFFKNDLG